MSVSSQPRSRPIRPSAQARTVSTPSSRALFMSVVQPSTILPSSLRSSPTAVATSFARSSAHFLSSGSASSVTVAFDSSAWSASAACW